MGKEEGGARETNKLKVGCLERGGRVRDDLLP